MLKPYQSSDFKLIESWIVDPELLFQYAATAFSFPLVEEQMLQYQSEHPDRKFYIGYTADNLPFAFGEIVPQEIGHPRLSRVLIGDPSLRGKGLGRYFIGLLIDECRKFYDPQFVDLSVWDKNIAAIKCYESVGFKINGDKVTTLVFKGKEYDIFKMTCELR